jgi:hypothetical protein
MRPPLIRVASFQPFPSRFGRDTVLSLRFAYDAQLVEHLKGILRDVRERYDLGPVGGWLPEYHCWFCERFAWPTVRARLMAQGCTIREDPGAEANAGPEQEPPLARAAANLPGLIRGWYHSLADDFHPDRGGSVEAMRVVNEAHDRLRKLVGV